MVAPHAKQKEDRMKNFLAFAISLFLFLLLGGKQAAAETECTRPEQVGCVQIDLLVVQKGQSDKLRTLINSEPASLVQGVDLALPIYGDVKSGEINLYSACAEYYIFFWGVTSVSTERMALYADGSNSSPPLKVFQAEMPNFFDEEYGEEVFPELGDPSVGYLVKVCGGKASFQVPWDYIGSQTYALICATSEDSLYPSKKKKQGLWISSKAWNFYREGAYQWILIPLVMP